MKAMKNRGATGWRAVLIAGALAFLCGPASAEIVSTEQALPQSDRDRVRMFLDRDGVEDQLKVLGVAPETARQRVQALTDEEVRTIAGRLDALPAGAALSSTDLILILLIVILVLVAI